MDEIIFREEANTYLVNGEEYPRVTFILKEAGIAPEIPFYTETGRLRGKYVHEACQLLDEGDLNYDDLDPILEPYVKAYELFLNENKTDWEGIEERVFNKSLGYVGTLDRRGTLNGSKTILDIKTGIVQPWAGLQIAAYEMCFDTPYQRYALQLKKNGTYKLHKFIDTNDYEVFKSAISIVNWKKNNPKPLSSRGDGNERGINGFS